MLYMTIVYNLYQQALHALNFETDQNIRCKHFALTPDKICTILYIY